MKKLIVATAVMLLGVAVAGCSKFSEPFQDAPTGARNTGIADIVTFPDGFSNVATKCDHGNRIYVVFKDNASYGAITVVPNDPSCVGK